MKKEKSKAPAKGGVADDKNVPKQIDVEYPEVESESNFLILEKSFASLNAKPEVKKPVAKSVMSTAGAGAGASAAGGEA
jgi:hypothetical protein